MSSIKKIQTSGGMTSHLDTNTGEFKVEQDAKPFIEAAKRERDMAEHFGHKDNGYRKACTIPDIVAVDLLYKYKIDIHSPEFMHDPASIRRVIQIMKTDYPHLMSY
jgi:hypothetical protein